jgi:hypothetical protein
MTALLIGVLTAVCLRVTSQVLIPAPAAVEPSLKTGSESIFLGRQTDFRDLVLSGFLIGLFMQATLS